MIMKINRYAPVLLAALFLLLPATALRAQENRQADSLASHIEQLLEERGGSAVFDVGGCGLNLVAETPRFYRQRQYAPAWLTPRGLSDEGSRLLAVLQGAQREGLRPEEYHTETLAVFVEQLRIFSLQRKSLAVLGLARFDILLSDAYLRYAGDLVNGRVKAGKVYPEEWRAAPRANDLAATLQAGLQHGEAVALLQDMLPDHPGYRRLRDYLAAYRQLAASGGWPQLPKGPLVRPGDKDWRLPWVRQHLVQVGDLHPAYASADDFFDQATADALVYYQARHGLKADAVLGPETVLALNVSIEERIRQIEINLERWRWLARDLGSRYLAVNIADFRLDVVEEGATVLSMPVVVGTDYRRTPVFSGQLRYLDFAPYWNVPSTILREDKLPLIKADLNYLASHHYEIVSQRKGKVEPVDPKTIDWEGVTAETFPGMLRQKPGPWNPLGRVKFMFPNKFHVYMHDTPERHLFERKRRSYSSGCIRLERPGDLALYLLQRQEGWDPQRVEAALTAEEPLRVLLDEPVPVHILYRTAWVDEQGGLQFRNDIYQRDALLYAALRRHNRKTATLVACSSSVLP
ncbi:MAG: L,D-transpeptidase family protein [Syntrophotaleaceae bacterium]